MGTVRLWLLTLALAPAPKEGPAVVHRGERVTLSARVGAVVASVPAEAMQDGRVGETVRVRNLHSQRVHSARVVAAGKVEVIN